MGSDKGVSISKDGGQSFITKTFSANFYHNFVPSVYGTDSHVFAATHAGLAISENGGESFYLRTIDDGLPSDDITKVFGGDLNVYVIIGETMLVSRDGAFKSSIKLLNTRYGMTLKDR